MNLWMKRNCHILLIYMYWNDLCKYIWCNVYWNEDYTLYSGFVLVIWLQFCFLLMEILSLADYKLCTGIMYHQNLSLNIFYSLLYKLVFVLYSLNMHLITLMKSCQWSRFYDISWFNLSELSWMCIGIKNLYSKLEF